MAIDDDVRVRLSAEGLNEVLAALRTVKAEAQRAQGAVTKPGQAGASSFANMATAAAGAGAKILAVAGITATAIVAIGRRAAESAEQMQNLAQGSGFSVRQLSALTVAARLANIPVDNLRGALTRYVNKAADVRKGNAQAAASFAKVGVSARELRGKDFGQQLEVVARGWSRMAPSIERTQGLIEIFGKDLAFTIVPLLDDVAENGIAGLEERARKLGLLLDANVVNRVSAVNNQLTILGLQVGAAFQTLIAGAAPDLLRVLQAFSKEMGDLIPLAGGVGRALGLIFKAVTIGAPVGALFINTINAIGFAAKVTTVNLEALAESTSLLLRGRGAEARERMRFLRQQNEDLDKEGARLRDEAGKRLRDSAAAVRDAFSRQPFGPPTNPNAGGGLGFGDGPDPSELAALRREILQSAADRELALVRATLKARGEAEERSFEAGILSLREYYQRREQAVRDGAAAELAALRRRRAIELGNPDAEERRRRVAAVDAQIVAATALKRIETEAELARLASDRRKAELDLARQVYDVERKAAVTEAERHRNAVLDIEAEATALEALLRKQGRPAEEIASRRLRFTTQRNTALEFDEARASAESALAALQSEREAIRGRVRQGLLTELQGEARLLQVERERLPQLEAIADALVVAARATGNPESVAAAEGLRQQMQQLRVETARADVTFTTLRNTVEQSLKSGLIDLLAEGRRETESWGDAFLRLADTIVAAARQLAAMVLVNKLFEPLGLSQGGFASAAASAQQFASGGLVFGPGSGTSDSVPAMLSHGEFVVRAAAVRRPNVREFLEALNGATAYTGMTLEVPRYGGFPELAEGGAIDASAGRVSGAITVGLEPGLVLSHLRTREGEQLILNVIAKNPRAARRALGMG